MEQPGAPARQPGFRHLPGARRISPPPVGWFPTRALPQDFLWACKARKRQNPSPAPGGAASGVHVLQEGTMSPPPNGRCPGSTSWMFLSFHPARWFQSRTEEPSALPALPPRVHLVCSSASQPERCPEGGKASINNTNISLVNAAFPTHAVCAVAIPRELVMSWHGTQTCEWQMAKAGRLWSATWMRSGRPHAACWAPLLQEVQPGRAVPGRPSCPRGDTRAGGEQAEGAGA